MGWGHMCGASCLSLPMLLTSLDSLCAMVWHRLAWMSWMVSPSDGQVRDSAQSLVVASAYAVK